MIASIALVVTFTRPSKVNILYTLVACKSLQGDTSNI